MQTKMDLGLLPRSKRDHHHPVNLSIMHKSDSNQVSLSQQIPYVIYRNSKYNGFLRRFSQHLIIYSRFYVLQPLLSRLNQFHIYLLEFLGFLNVIFLAPFLLCSALVLYLIRRIRISLVKKFHPNAIICEDFSPRCILTRKSHGMMSAVVWVHGKITLQTVLSEFGVGTSKYSILKRTLTDKFGVRVWLDNPGLNGKEYDISQNIIEAPLKFYETRLTDDDSSQKSSLQKFVTSCASKTLDPEKPPWEITLIPQVNHSKERTCCILRFHYLLIRNKDVNRFLGNIFTRESLKQFDSGDPSELTNSNFKDPANVISDFFTTIFSKWNVWVRNNFITTQEDWNTWTTLQKKEWQFHPKSTFLKAKFFAIVFTIWSAVVACKLICWKEFSTKIQEVMAALFLILRALGYIPVEIIGCLWSVHPERNGIRHAGIPETRQVAWSSPISSDILEAIQEKIEETDTESIILTACSLALRDYYEEASLKNPRNLHVSVSQLSEDLLAQDGFKAVLLPTEKIQLPGQINKVYRHLEGYAPWKVLGSRYLVTYSSFVLPRAIAYLVLKNLFKRCPMNFSFVDYESSSPIDLPIMSLWGHAIDELTFWSSPQPDFCVSIAVVKYLETRRLAVISPMKALDRALTKHFSQHLNRIAESVGVDKSRIPYSRRSSPSSSYCTSPSLNLNSFGLRCRMPHTR